MIYKITYAVTHKNEKKKHRQISSMTHTRTDTHNEGCCAFWYQNELKKYKKIGSNKRIKDHKIYIAQNNINVHIKSETILLLESGIMSIMQCLFYFFVNVCYIEV